jgi:prevent-host-death family protein
VADMIQSNINEIKTRLSSYLDKVVQGETVIVCKRNVPIAQIKPIAPKLNKSRPVGLGRKKYPGFELNDECLEPLPDDVIATF